jgi:hypothetical protein
MRYNKWISTGVVILLVLSCFLPWYRLEWLDLTITGMQAGEKFGKPAYWHFILSFFFLLFVFVPRVWAKQWNVFIAAVNCAWTARNFFALAMCSGGECPERQYGIWLLLIAGILLLIVSLFPDIKIPGEKSKQ